MSSFASLAAIGLLAAGHVSGAAGARTFVAALYAHYPLAEHGPGFDPLGKDEAQVFDPSLIALIAEDQRLTPEGDAPELDGDPLCDCQDDAGLAFEITDVRVTGPLTATARVMRVETHANPPAASPITLDLAKSASGWRVRDISTDDMPSLQAFLLNANQERKAKPAP